MKVRFRRTTVAGVVTLLALSLPCVAWYVTGSHAARQEAERIVQEAKLEARHEAERLATQLQRRLEAMRQNESRRSFKDYQNIETDFLDDCSYELRLDSSLAEGPADPLIWTHFQMDEVGQITLPSLSAADRAEDSSGRSVQLAISEELECATSYRMADLFDREDDGQERLVRSVGGVITVGPFEWFTIGIRDQPALVALRTVRTPRVVVTQGFVVLSDAMHEFLADSPFAVSLRPGEPSNVGEAIVLLGEERWAVAVDAGAALAEAETRAAGVMRRFRLAFGVGSLGAALAATFLVGLVWQADRLAVRRTQFAASAAHELRTPLAGMRLYGEMLAENIGDPGKREQYARRISEEADRLGRVVSNVLGYTRMERGSLQVRAQRGDLADAVRSSLSKLAPALEAKGARVRLEVSEPLPLALFDRDAVHQILLNLTDNAEKYTRSAPDRTIEIVLQPNGAGPLLSVIDHGPGVAPEVRARLFQPFTRGPNPDGPAGLGIGLALVKALAAEQRATVAYRDATGGGGCFTVAFQGGA